MTFAERVAANKAATAGMTPTEKRAHFDAQHAAERTARLARRAAAWDKQMTDADARDAATPVSPRHPAIVNDMTA